MTPWTHGASRSARHTRTRSRQACRRCSVGPTFVPPTNVELVAQASQIVVAKVVSGVAGGPAIDVEITRVLRGTGLAKGARVTISGSLDRYAGPSPDRFDFRRARPGAYAGSCTALDYKLDRSYLLLLEPGGSTLGIPFARVNEEIDPASDPWLAAVVEYIKVADAPAATRRKLLGALVARGKRPRVSKLDAAIAADVATHLATPSKYKSFAELEPLFKAAKDDRARGRVVIAIGTGGDPGAKQFMLALVTSVAAGTVTVPEYIAYNAIGSYFELNSDPAAITAIARHFVAAKAKGHDRWPLMQLLVKRADASHAQDMLAALGTADDEEAGHFVEWFGRFPSQSAARDFRARIGKDFDKARFELVIGLAGLSDPDVIAWSKKKLAAKPDDKRWMALYAIARSPLPAADIIASRVIAKNGPDLESLIDGYAEAHHAQVEPRLAQIEKLKLSTEAAKALQRVRAGRAAKP